MSRITSENRRRVGGRSPRPLAPLALACSFALLALACSCSPAKPLRPAAGRPHLDAERPRALPAEGEPDVASALLAAHNAERARRRLKPLVLNETLTAVAQAHADDMARRGRMSHRGADGSSPFDRIARAGYGYRAAAENVAAGFDGVDSVMAGWMRSPGHRRNILGPTAEVGVGHAVASAGASYWCVTFGTPGPTVSRRGPESPVMLRQVATPGSSRSGRGGDRPGVADGKARVGRWQHIHGPWPPHWPSSPPP